MTQFILDLFFASIFILLLILMVKMRERAFADNKESYRYAMMGMSVLAIVAFLQLAAHQDLLGTIPFLSEPIYQELAQVIGIVAGVALMIAGISIWLPVRKRKEDETVLIVKRHDAIEKIEQSITDAENSNRLFRVIPPMICRAFGYDAAAVFKLHAKARRFIGTDFHGIDDDLRRQLQQESFSLGESIKAADELGSKYAFRFCLPLKLKDLTVALILFRGGQASAAEEGLFQHIGRIFSNRLEREFQTKKISFHEKSLRFLSEARGIASGRADIKDNLPALYRLFNRACEARFFSLAVTDKNRKNLRRYTCGINGQILLDGVTSPDLGHTYLDRVLEYRQSLLINDVTIDSAISTESLFVSCGQKSLMSVPIVSFGRAVGVLTLGHPMPGRFGRKELFLLEILSEAISPLIEADLSRGVALERDRYLGAISNFENIADNCANSENLLDAAAELLLRNVMTTMVRISVLNSDRSQLISRAIKTIRPFESIKNDAVSLSSELTRWHQMVVTENRLLLINQNDSESYMDPGEMESLVFRGMQSALIVPIAVNGMTYGIITLGEMRQWDRFSYDSAAISFCKAIAARLGSALKMMQLSQALLKEIPDNAAYPRNRLKESDLYQNLKTPLTALRGSLDLLKIQGRGEPEENSGRIIASMEESAERIISILDNR
ncbi:MAG: GAF domain-containing protein [candidate division Zixibacteria bacterium]|nr:GAF domain-containing protein [candidate division Zixibacteria bacterium]